MFCEGAKLVENVKFYLISWKSVWGITLKIGEKVPEEDAIGLTAMQ
jgi:hypothetical protein